MTKLVSTLIGDDLALCVARALKYKVRQEGGKWQVFPPSDENWRSIAWYGWCPDRSWAYGGRLIEDHCIAIGKGANQTTFPGWHAKAGLKVAYGDKDEGVQFGPTPLIAAMRALVASVYGKEVPNEENT